MLNLVSCKLQVYLGIGKYLKKYYIEKDHGHYLEGYLKIIEKNRPRKQLTIHLRYKHEPNNINGIHV